jgi:hypothetical protein
MPEELPDDLGPEVRTLALPIVEKAREAGWRISATWENKRDRVVRLHAKSPTGRTFFVASPESLFVEWREAMLGAL